MKKILFTLLMLFSCVNFVNAEEVTMYFFYGETCPHCEKEHEFLDELEKEYENLTILRYEVWYNEENQELMKEKADEVGLTTQKVPLTIVGDNYIVGYTTSYNSKIEKMVTDAMKTEQNECTPNENVIELPLLGEVNVKKISIGLVSAIIGLVDGFNPCAMWILLFLISMLIGMKDRKRMWIIGLTFLFTSALIYLLIMMSWLNLVVNIGLSLWIRYIIATIAVIGAIFNISKYFKSKDSGCDVVKESKRTKVFDKIRKFTHEKSLFLALIGVITLAISVNFIELMCSAGLPLVYTEILAINDISGLKALGYTLIYILFFLFDDLIIFFIAMITLKISAISTKYTKYSHLVGGIIMLIIGLLLIFKPEWIMFNF